MASQQHPTHPGGNAPATSYAARLAAWTVVFPPEHDGIPNVAAEWLAALEDALHELRETRRPLPRAQSAYVISAVDDLLNALGEIASWNSP